MEDSQVTEVQIQEILRDAEQASEPGSVATDTLLHKTIEGVEAEMKLQEVTSAGYLYVWDTETGEKLPILSYMLPAKMRQLRPDGKPRFTGHDPKIKIWRGQIKCRLHQDDPERKHFDDLGLRVCRKSNITNPHALIQHMRLKHPQEWKQIDEEKKGKERLEDRQLQQAILLSLTRDKVEPNVESKEEKKEEGLDPVYLKRVENMAKAREARKKK